MYCSVCNRSFWILYHRYPAFSKLHTKEKMAKQISQDTFDAVVKENIEEFEMEPEEALDDAIQQFEAQVCSLL